MSAQRWVRPNTLLHTQTYQPLASVAEFHQAFGVKPFIELGDDERSALLTTRATLIGEEYSEVYDEILNALQGVGDMEALAKELADLLYVVYGTAEVLDIPLEDVFNEVHRSNMSKLGEDGKPIYREDGKVLKGPHYQKADVHGAMTGEWL